MPVELAGGLPIAYLPRMAPIGGPNTPVDGFGIVVKHLRDDADKGDRGAQRIADRRVAAGGVKSEQALGREPQAGDVLPSLRMVSDAGRDLDDVGAALRVEQIGAAELVGKGLAVIAIADHAIDLLRRGVLDPPDHLPAAATQLHSFAMCLPVAGRLAANVRRLRARHKRARAFGRKNHRIFRPPGQRTTLAAPHSLPMSVAKLHGLEDWP